ncbi:DUF4882 family protein [Acinetobacter sp. ANC 4648]|uniref:DUF4882 family protein n=1 Tax=Acinetobacter sp. ANC 4648 TaxID=1977875 RepID=UPI000A345C97|nr:DUF4882 family protein [Acinetobacter sp. ANC 4648]OTG80384.1 hypothetical protein B9T27_13605 [Acinetobacter sp. ANC 4648]
MNKIYFGILLGSALSGNVLAECSYNFDATQAQINTIYPHMTLFPDLINQKATFTTQGSETYIAINKNDIAGMKGVATTPQSGIFVYEYKMKVPGTLLSTNEQMLGYPTAVAFNDAGNVGIGFVYINNLHNPSTPRLNALSFGIFTENGQHYDAGILPISATNDGYQYFGIYINQDTKKIGFILNGVNYGYVQSIQSKIHSVNFTNTIGFSEIGSNSTIYGKNYSIELITDGSKIVQTYPSGSKDICGNTI